MCPTEQTLHICVHESVREWCQQTGVKTNVEFGKPLVLIGHSPQQVLCLSQTFRVVQRHGDLERDSFDSYPEHRGLDDVVVGEGRHYGTNIRSQFHQSLAGEPGHGLPHRDFAHAEIGGDPVNNQPLTWEDVRVLDQTPHVVEHKIGLAAVLQLDKLPRLCHKVNRIRSLTDLDAWVNRIRYLISPEVAVQDSRNVYVAGKIVPAEDGHISVFDAGFQSGDAIWEGLRVYNGRVFRLQQHLERLAASARALRIPLPLSLEDIAHAIADTLAANDLHEDTHIRLMVTRGTRRTSGMDPRNAPSEGTLVIVPESKPVPVEPAPQRLRTASMRRPGPHVLDPSIHHANQLNSILARLEILDEPDIDATLMLDTDGYVAEADSTNIFCLTNGVLRTPLPTACLHGITRELVLELAESAGYEVQERQLTLSDFYSADEVFVTGTVCELVPVVTIDNRQIGDGQPGPHWRRLLELYRDRVNGETR